MSVHMYFQEVGTGVVGMLSIGGIGVVDIIAELAVEPQPQDES